MGDTLETTWGELEVGYTVLDATGKQWRVYSDPARLPNGMVDVGITDGDRYLSIRHYATDTVLIVPAAVADITNGAVATETAEQTRTRQVTDTYPNPSEFSPLELRTHLYLVHGDHGATQPMPFAGMVARHDQLHEQGPGPTPHAHQEQT